MKKWSIAAAAALFSGSAAYADCGEVQMADFNWQSAQVVTAIGKFLMEQGYGCEVKMIPTSTTSAIASIQENGTPEIMMEIWSNANKALNPLKEDGTLLFVSQMLSEGGQQGWWVPTYMVDQHPELATLDGIIANPDLVGGRFFNCPDGWTCRNTNANMAKAVDMEGAGIEVFTPGSGETLSTSIASAYEDKKPWFGYYWAPTPLLGQYSMTMVDVGEYDAEAFNCNTTAECADPKMSSYPVDEVWNVITADLAAREPEVTELLSKMSMTNQQVGALLAWQDANNASADETAVYFLTSSPDVWSGWLDDAAREKLSALLQ